MNRNSPRKMAQLKLEKLESRDAPAVLSLTDGSGASTGTVFTVTSVADSGTGSLRQAILNANANPGTDTIRFQIAGGAPTIVPMTALPAISDAVILDGASQTGYAGTPLVTLDGSAAPVGSSGLVLANHTGSTIRGLTIVNFSKGFTGTFIDAAGISIRNGGGHTIQGNYIGTDGVAAKANGYGGIMVNSSNNNLIGGTTALARNVISGNRSLGIYIVNPLSVDNRVQGNYIGVNAAGTGALPNGAATTSNGGIVIAGFGPGGAIPIGRNVIGGAEAGAGNLIAFERFGVRVVGSSGNRILGNRMHDNGAGIVLDSGSTENDPGDSDTGGNNRQNQPKITLIKNQGGLQISGSLTSAPNTTYRIEIFRSAKSGLDYWGNGQGGELIGSVQITSDAQGVANFQISTSAATAGQFVVATATDLTTGDTSAFSQPMVVPAANGGSIGGANSGFAVAAGSGEPRVWVYNPDGTLNRTFIAYDSSFRGGVRVAMADVNGDGDIDIITAAGAGGGPHIKVFSGPTGNLLTEFFAYDPRFSGGVNVAAADLNGDGKAEVITGAGPGGGPHVKAFNLANGQLMANFFAYDASFRGGVSVAAADLDGTGQGEIITGAGAGGGPHLRVWTATGVAVRETFVYGAASANGLSIAAGDFDGDGKAEIAISPQTGGPALVRVLNANLAAIKDINVFENDYRGGTTIAMRDTNGDGMAEVLVGVRQNGRPKILSVKPQGAPTDAVVPEATAPEGVYIG